MSIQTLATLENAIEPYRKAGYVIVFQSDVAITLQAPVPQFSWALFLTCLFLLWPVAIIYLIRFNRQRGRTVCMRVTSAGQLEASGFTLDMLERERQRRSSLRSPHIILFLLTLSVIVGLLFLTYVGIINS